MLPETQLFDNDAVSLTQIWFNEQGRKWNSSKIKMENKDLLSAPLKRKHCWILSLTEEKKDLILDLMTSLKSE